MKHPIIIFLLLISMLSLGWQATNNHVMAQSEETSTIPLLYVHYMPWYQAPDTSGFWGWHWTMEFFDPSNLDENSRPELASHYMPLTGPYDSKDPAILEYQVLLMKMTGIDGVIVDWYGTEDFRDYALINEATVALFEYTKKAGLGFAVAYEDATVNFMVNEAHFQREEALSHGQEVMQYLEENWMSDPSYLRYNEQALLFIFGPQYFRSPSDWETMFSGLETSPALITLDGHMDYAAFSSYPWPPMHFSGGAELAVPVLEGYLSLFYENIRRSGNEFVVGGAFPRFHDIYEEAGVRSSYGYLDAQDGATFRLTFDMALENNADLIQIITWNDYGEGTIIEPTDEFGYQYLEIVQELRHELNPDFSFTSEDLTIPLQLFNLRKAHIGDDVINAQLDEVFTALINGDIETAQTILASFE